MKKIVLILGLIVSINVLFAQDYNNKFDYKIGVGSLVAGKGNILSVIENEVNYKLNNYFALSLYLDNGRSIGDSDGINDYMQLGSNVFISPFKNNSKNNFKVGLGLAMINETMKESLYLDDNRNHVTIDGLVKETQGAFTFVFEDEYRINSRFFIGGKLFTVGKFQKSDLMIGAMMKFGIAL